MRRLIFGLVVAAGAAAFLQSCAGTTVVSTDTAAGRHNPTDVEWTRNGGNPDEQRYSKLNQVTVDNVGQLGLAWFAEIGRASCRERVYGLV